MQNTALQGHQQAAQYVYSSNSYTGQQGAAPASANSAAYAPQAYAQQSYPQQSYVQQVQVQQPQAAVSQPTYGSNTTYGAVGAASQTQSAQPQAVPWSQQASAATAQPAPQQQSAYGRSSTGVASAASGGGSSGGAAQYGGQYNSVYGTAVQSNPQQVQQVQQALGSTARGVASPDFQAQTTAGSRGSAAYGQGPDRAMNTGASYVVGGTSSVSASGVYGADATKYDDNDKYGAGASSGSYDGKNSDYGAASSPSGYSQKAPDQYGANYNIKSSDYSQSDRAQYGQNQSAYGQADSQGGAVRRYHDTQAAIAVAQQRQQQQQQQQQQQHQQQERQDQQSQLIRQQQALQAQAQQQAAAALLSRGAASSVLDGGARNQNDYLGGSRAGPARGGSQEYGQVRGLLGPSYGGSRSDADAGLLVSQYGGAGGRSTGPVNSIGYGAQQAGMYAALNAGRGLTGQMYAHSAPVIGYGGVQLPPGREYSAGRGTGGGGYIAGGSRSDRPSIGSSRFEDRRDDRPPPRRDGGRDDRRGGGGGIVGGGGGGGGAGGGGGGRDRERDRLRNRDRERDRERDRLRNRDRERDTHRDRRDDLRKRERSPLRPARDHKDPMPGKRDERSGRKESPRLDLPHRIMSPAKEKRRDYLCKIEQLNFVDAERDYTTLCKRYAKLYVVPEFAKLAVCWLGKESQIRLSQPISFEHDAVDVEDEGDFKEAPPKSSDKVSPSPATFPTKGTTTWNSKVMLMSGFSETALAELLSDSNVEDKPPHLHNLLKFVALRKDRSAIMACGGSWDKDLDGGDPATDEDALIRTAIRCTKQSTELDLSSCTQWLRFLEVHYERLGEDGLPSHNDVTVIYVPDLSQVVPLLEDWQQQWTQWKQAKLDRETLAKGEKEIKPAEKKSDVMEVDGNGSKDVEEPSARVEGETLQDDNKDKVLEEKVDIKPEEVVAKGKATEVSKDTVVKPEEDLPLQPGLLLTTKRTKSTKMRSMTISLDGLLDYDEEDREECTFELSVFAEVYQEMLEYKMASLILSDLEVLRATVYARKREERKRLRTAGKDETQKEVEGEGSSSRKRSKFSDKAGTPEPKMEIDPLPNTELVPELKIEIVLEPAIEIVPEPKIETLPEPQAETLASDTVPEVVPENRLEIEASEILNANSEEDLQKLVAKKEEAVAEQEKVMVESLAEKAEENGDGHKDDKKELDAVSLSEAEVGQGATDIVVDTPEVAVTTASSDADMKDAAATKERGSIELVDDKKLEKKEHVLSKEVLQAYRYFDRNRVGYLKSDDVRRLLHSLGRFLSHRNVKELVVCAVSESSKTRDERVVYRNFTEKETTTVE